MPEWGRDGNIFAGTDGVDTGFDGDGWGRILILQGRMEMGINVRPRTEL